MAALFAAATAFCFSVFFLFLEHLFHILEECFHKVGIVLLVTPGLHRIRVAF